MRQNICHFIVFMFAIGAIGVPAVPAHAGTIVSAETVSAMPGSTGFFQILLKNDSLSSQSLSSFSVEIALSGTGVRFIGVDDVTSPGYVFDGFGTGLLSFDVFPNSGFIASDISLNLDGFVDIAAGQTVGLARIAFEVDNAAPAGVRSISFISGPTSVFTDAVGDFFADVDVSFSYGGFDVQGSVGVVPEPSSITSFVIGLGCALAGYRHRRRLSDRERA
jgi:hypothetical protein